MSEQFHFKAGGWSLNQGYFDAAIRHFEKVLNSCTDQNSQNRMVSLFELGQAFKLNCCLNAAILCFEKVLTMHTENINRKVATEIRSKAENDIEFCNKIRNYRIPLNAIFRPNSLIIEPINFCNYSCYKCLYPGMKRNKTKLDPSKYEKFLSSWARRFGEFEEIIFSGGGEALLNKRLTEIVHISSRWMPHSQLTIGTNLSLLTENRAKELIDAGLNSWEVSLDTDDPEEYKKITEVDSFDTVLENIEILWNALDKGKKGMIEVAAHRSLDEHYFEKMQRISNLVSGMCTNFRNAPYQTLMGRKDNPGLDLWEQTMNYDSPADAICLDLWEQLIVTSDGNI